MDFNSIAFDEYSRRFSKVDEGNRLLRYSKHLIGPDDVQAVVDAMESEDLNDRQTIEFENNFSDYLGVDYSLAVSSGTAALHCALYAAEVGPGDEVIL
ncbi:MAG: DegT/DnrJ/EryC1/StrS family aminotransferase, partial [Planctomycetota bacterium]